MKKTIIFFALLSCIINCCAQSNDNEIKSKNDNPIKSVVILGNSIVIHGPKADIGWSGNWGMAASVADSDFVHRLMADIHKVDSSTKVSFGSVSTFEREYESYDFSQLAQFRNADMLIIKISENVVYDKSKMNLFMERYNKLMKYLAPKAKTQKIIVEGFWPTPVNDSIKAYAQKNKIPFVPLADLYSNDPSNSAAGLFENPGVARHPSDKGMRNIADRIWKCISKYFH
jgi:hypothetical protein